MNPQKGWWRTHDYHRKQVRDIKRFCGWPFLLKMIRECEATPYYEHTSNLFSDEARTKLRQKLIERDKALVATAFLSGGRISEVLTLRKSNFTVQKERVIMDGALLLKRYDKKDEDVEVLDERPEGALSKLYYWSQRKDGWTRRVFSTEPVAEIRDPVPIPKFEPLTPLLLERLEKMEDWLFPTNYKVTRKPKHPGVALHLKETFGLEHRTWLSETRAYQILRSLGKRLKTHVWSHWMRAQRASQLASEYGFNEQLLNRFFGWTAGTFRGKEPMAQRYARLGVEDLWEKMQKEKIRV